MLTVNRVQQEKFAVDGIAEREAVRFREASDRVEKKLLALIRILKFPRFAAVCRLVDARLFSFAAGHQIGNLLGERHDPAKVERVTPINGQALPRLAFVDGFQNQADGASGRTRPGISGRSNMREKTSRRLSALLFLIIAGSFSWPVPVSAQFHPKDTEWPSYAADLAGTRYRPLDQINATNFSDLEIAWRIKTDNFGDRPEYKLEGTPLMVNGVLYATAGSRRAVIALDPATGELLWTHGEHEGKRGGAAPRQLSGRGLAYWSDGREERIFYVTPGFRLICLDAKTGVRIPSFGENGLVDLKLNDDQDIFPDLETGEIGIQSAPVVAKDTVIIV